MLNVSECNTARCRSNRAKPKTSYTPGTFNIQIKDKRLSRSCRDWVADAEEFIRIKGIKDLRGSFESLAKVFNTSRRSITRWIKEAVKYGLFKLEEWKSAPGIWGQTGAWILTSSAYKSINMDPGKSAHHSKEHSSSNGPTKLNHYNNPHQIQRCTDAAGEVPLDPNQLLDLAYDDLGRGGSSKQPTTGENKCNRSTSRTQQPRQITTSQNKSNQGTRRSRTRNDSSSGSLGTIRPKKAPSKGYPSWKEAEKRNWERKRRMSGLWKSPKADGEEECSFQPIASIVNVKALTTSSRTARGQNRTLECESKNSNGSIRPTRTESSSGERTVAQPSEPRNVSSQMRTGETPTSTDSKTQDQSTRSSGSKWSEALQERLRRVSALGSQTSPLTPSSKSATNSRGSSAGSSGYTGKPSGTTQYSETKSQES